MVNDGLFRLDLYYRLTVLTVNIPPLRQREGDIITLAYFFLKKHCGNNRILPNMDKKTQLKLMEYHWPGNVRQLENAMIYALNVFDNNIILPENLPDEITQGNIRQYSSADKPVLKMEQKHESKLIKQFEENAIRKTLSETDNNIALAASLLGVSKSTLYRKAKILGIQ